MTNKTQDALDALDDFIKNYINTTSEKQLHAVNFDYTAPQSLYFDFLRLSATAGAIVLDTFSAPRDTT